MTLFAGNMREILSWEIKPRCDSVTDQYSRMFMCKLLIICSLVCGLDFLNDKVNCLISKKSEISPEFVHASCWIAGFYVFREMDARISQSAYYGIPKNMDFDGIDEKGELCTVRDRSGYPVKDCLPMTKRYFLQYQWIAFYIASLSILYYLPYMAFKIVNTDIISLVDSIREGRLLADDVANNYFSYKFNSKMKMRMRILGNFIIKILYVVANICGMLLTDFVLNGQFLFYGLEWSQWNMLPGYVAHDIGKRSLPKPGNQLLPPWGFCELHEAVRDVRTTTINSHKFICEISSNLIYQYIFIILWFAFSIGIAISIMGWLLQIGKHFKTIVCIYKPGLQKGTLTGEMYALLTMREIEYLEVIKQTSLPKYGDVMRRLTKQRQEMFSLKRFFNSELNGLTLL